MKFSKVVFVLIALALAGCDPIETPDGKLPAVPQKYLGLKTKAQGRYVGRTRISSSCDSGDSRSQPLDSYVEATLSLDHDKPILRFSRDILGNAACRSSVGRMLWIGPALNITGEPRVMAAFQFDPGKNCAGLVASRELIVAVADGSEVGLDFWLTKSSERTSSSRPVGCHSIVEEYHGDFGKVSNLPIPRRRY